MGESSRVTSHLFLPIEPGEFNPPELGAYICWGANSLIVVVDSSQGLDNATVNFAVNAANHHPVIIAITGLDHDRANFDETLAVSQRVFGTDRQVVAISLPVLNDLENVQGILNMLTESIYWTNSHGELEEHDLDREHYELIGSRLDELLNALVVTTINDSFAQDVINGDSIDAESLYKELVAATLRCELIPVMPVSGIIGLAELATLSSDIGVGNLDTWSPFSHCNPDEAVGTVLTGGLIRIWQGVVSTGEYQQVDQAGTRSQVTVTIRDQSDAYPGGKVIPITTAPQALPGATISTTGVALTIPVLSD